MRSVRRVSSATIELERYKKAITELEGRIKKANSERDLASQKVSQLEHEVSVLRKESQRLLEEQKADRKVIENLREMMQQDKSAEVIQNVKEQVVVDKKQQQGVKDVEEGAVKYDTESVMKMLSSGGSLKDTISRIITSEGVDSTLQRHSENPAHWVAAASLEQDPEAELKYLEQAANLYPESSIAISSLINARITHKQIDEATMAYIDQMKKVDPTNALADCYAAYCQFNSGDVEAALQSLSQASMKDRFADDSIDLLMARNDYFLNEGCSSSISLGLSAFDLPLSHMGMLRELSEYAMVQADTLHGTARYEDALKVVTDISKLGGTLSSSSRFIVSDRVGMALQISALERAKQLYEVLGDVAKSEEVDSQLEAVQQRSDTIDIMAQVFGDVMQNMGEKDIADYVNGTILKGEFSTLQNLPEIAAALEQARKKQQEEPPEPNVP